MSAQLAPVTPSIISPRHRRHAITLVEMMLAMGLFAIAGTLFTHIFRSAWQVTQSAQASADTIPRVDLLLGTLRRDVWGASRIQLLDPHTLRLTEPDGMTVIWKSEPGGRLGREVSPGAPQTWEDLLLGDLTMSCDGPSVIVSAPGANVANASEIRFINQPLLEKGRQ